MNRYSITTTTNSSSFLTFEPSAVVISNVQVALYRQYWAEQDCIEYTVKIIGGKWNDRLWIVRIDASGYLTELVKRRLDLEIPAVAEIWRIANAVAYEGRTPDGAYPVNPAPQPELPKPVNAKDAQRHRFGNLEFESERTNRDTVSKPRPEPLAIEAPERIERARGKPEIPDQSSVVKTISATG